MFNSCVFRCAVLAAAVILLLPAAVAGDLDGKWNFVFVSENGEHPRVITMKTDGDKVNARIGEEPLEGTCTHGKLEIQGEHFAPEAGYKGLMKISGTVEGGKIKGTATWEAYSLTFNASKAE